MNYPIYTFHLFLLNDVPVFSPLLTTQKVEVGLTKIYSLTTFDFEGAVVTITLLTPSLPPGVIFTNPTFQFSPPFSEPDTTYTITMGLSDGPNSPTYTFIYNVVNDLPFLSHPFPSPNMHVGDTPITIDISNHITDPQGNSLTAWLNGSPPSFISISGTVISFAPTHMESNQSGKVSFSVNDGANTVAFQISYTVINDPPFFEDFFTK